MYPTMEEVKKNKTGKSISTSSCLQRNLFKWIYSNRGYADSKKSE